jgi:hypothetical protein
MKNLKNIVATIILITAFGTTFANAGIIIAKDSAQCPSSGNAGILEQIGGRILQGIIIAKTGIIIARDGIIIAKEGAGTCDSQLTKEGIIIA